MEIQTVEQIEEENKQRDWNWIRRILGNNGLLRWVKQFSAENLSEDVNKITDNFKEYIKISEYTIGIMDKDNVKMLLTDTKFKGRALAVYSLEHLEEIIKVVGRDGRLIIVKEDYPSFVEVSNKEGSNLVVLAPRASNDESEVEE